MKVYQVTKYDPKLYGPHGYKRDEWQGYGEVENIDARQNVSFAEYLEVENAYARAVSAFVNMLGGTAQLDRFDDFRSEMTRAMDRSEITDPDRSYKPNTPILETSAIEDCVRLYLRGFIGADIIIPQRGFVDFDYDFYMYFGMRNAQQIDWTRIRQGVLFERNRSAELYSTDSFDKCVNLAGLTKTS